jgi:tetratricopeptide (TPR) repeat protein
VRIEASFVRRLEALSDDARRVLLIAAAEPVGDPLLLWRAAEQLGIAVLTVDAETDGLLATGERVTFRHPLVRSAVYRTATREQRREVHLAWVAISARQVREARDAGALARLPIDLADWAILVAWCGDFGAAAAAIAEAEAITKATGAYLAPYPGLLLAALRGQSDALPMIESTIRDAGRGGQGLGVQWAEWVSAILFNGLGRYDRALAAAQRAVEETPQLQVAPWAMTELIEAAVRSARADLAMRSMAW